MHGDQFEAVFDRVTNLVIAYQPGDLLMASDIGDAIAELSALSPSPVAIKPIFEILARLCEQEIKAGLGPVFAQAISHGVDLLQSIFNEHDSSADSALPLSSHVATAIQAFIADYSRFVTTHESPPKPQPPSNSEPLSSAKNDFEEPIKEKNQNQVMATFLQDARERLEIAQIRVLDLEKSDDPAPVFNELFRVFHTFKGETGFLRLPNLGELAHHYENILDHLRNGRIQLKVEIIDLLLEGIDTANSIIKRLGQFPGDEGDVRIIKSLVLRISSLLNGTASPMGMRLVEKGAIKPEQVELILKKQRETNFAQKFGEIAVAEGFISQEDIQHAIADKPPEPPPAKIQVSEAPIATEQMIKVRAGQIQYLVDMLGELLISLNQLDDTDRRVQASRKIAKNLQLAAMQASTVGIGVLFSTMRRVIRESSRLLGKEADLIIAGDDLEVDRKLVDKLGEPLMHLLRNAIGHGIEPNSQRLAAGKPERGKIELTAARTGHNVVIKVRDDGKGLDCDKIRAKAIEKGLISPERAANMSRLDTYNLIFLPGFSTAENIDAISGRGVGMDVVKTMVEQLRGRVHIESQPGHFTEVSLTFAINMAIVDGMIVQIGPRLMVIPVAVIVESLSIDPTGFRQIGSGAVVCSLRGETMPVIDLGAWFGLGQPKDAERHLAVVVEAAGGKYALLVHDIVAKKEIVIKSLGRIFSNIRGISSATILQGGRIGLVLDVDQIVRTE